MPEENASSLQLYGKRDSDTGALLWNLRDFSEHLFTKHLLRITASEMWLLLATISPSHPRLFPGRKKQLPDMFCKNRCSQKFRKFYRKTPMLESLFNKAAGRQSCSFIKKIIRHRCFPVNSGKFLKTTILQNTCKPCFWIGWNESLGLYSSFFPEPEFKWDLVLVSKHDIWILTNAFYVIIC